MTIIDLYEVMATSKSDARQKVVKAFLKEACGSKDETSRYEYNVEKYKEYKIVLKRPGVFKKGFDFTVNIRGLYFKKNSGFTLLSCPGERRFLTLIFRKSLLTKP